MPSWDLEWTRRLRDLAREENRDPSAARPANADPAPEDPALLGVLAVDQGLIQPGQLQECLREQHEELARGNEKSLGEILLQRNYISPEDLRRLTEEQKTRAAVPFHLSRYEIKESIGEGATAIVYRAFDRDLHRPVALKVLREGLGVREVARLRFRREAQAAAGLSHPNLVAVYDAGEIHGRLYLVMELIEGPSLSVVLERAALTGRDRVVLLEKVARGVAAIHAKGIVHRDLKPANILVPSSGEPKVGDLGLAHLIESETELTRTGAAVGSPLYMAPEQVEGKTREIGPPTDVYALGAILFEALAGRPPFVGDRIPEIYAKILNEEPPPLRKLSPKVDRDLETIVHKALDKEPSRRYGEAGALAEDLQRFLAGEPIIARPASLMRRAHHRVRKNPVAYAAGAVAIVALLLAVFVFDAMRAKARHLEKEQDEAVKAFEQIARMSLESALQARRSGQATKEMAKFSRPMEEAHLKVIERAPKAAAEVNYLMGKLYRETYDGTRALEYIERALQVDPDYLPALCEKVSLKSYLYWNRMEKLAAGASKEAVERQDSGIAASRDEIQNECARLERLFGETAKDKRSPLLTPANVLTARGMVEVALGNPSAAIDALREAVGKDPSLTEAWEWLAVSIGSTKDEKRLSLMEECYTKALVYDRGNIRLWKSRADVRMKTGVRESRNGRDPSEFYEGAETDLGEALRINPEFGQGWLLRGRLHSFRATYRISRNQDPEALFLSAEECFTRATRIDKHYAPSWLERADLKAKHAAYLEKKNDPARAGERYASATKDYDEALRLAPDLSSQARDAQRQARLKAEEMQR